MNRHSYFNLYLPNGRPISCPLYPVIDCDFIDRQNSWSHGIIYVEFAKKWDKMLYEYTIKYTATLDMFMLNPTEFSIQYSEFCNRAIIFLAKRIDWSL
jgi:hypothetical protein